ncbi:MAG: tetratricopeptide repeat-containing diguanylate cyclase [Lachnospiraceae bacterium]
MQNKHAEGNLECIRENVLHNPQKANYLCKEYILQGKADKDAEAVAYGEYYLGETFFTLGHVECIMSHTMKALAYFEKSKNEVMKTKCYNLLGLYCSNFQENQMALEYYFKALDLMKEKHLRMDTSTIYNNIGVIYSFLGDYEEALKYYTMNEKKIRKRKKDNKSNLCYSIINQIECYFALGKYERASERLKEIEIEDYNEIGYLFDLNVMIIKTKLLYKQGAVSDANDMLEEIIQKASIGYDTYEIYQDYEKLIAILFELKEVKRAKRVINILFQSAKKIDTVYVWTRVYSLMIQYYQLTGEQDKLRENYEKYYELSQERAKVFAKEQISQVHNIIKMRELLEKYRQDARKNESIQIRSERDELTGLMNRYSLNLVSQKLFDKAKTKQQKIGCLFLDLNCLKLLNDQQGHLEGDDCLKKIGKFLQEMEDEKHLFARYYGDEFFALIDNEETQDIVKFAKKIRNEMMAADNKFQLQEGSEKEPIAIGIVNVIPGNELVFSDMIRYADLALYQVKHVVKEPICVVERLMSGEKVMLSYEV